MFYALTTLLLLTAPSQAQDTLEIGVIRNDDIHVVQRMLYPKANRSEFGLHVGLMPFDPYLTTPNLQVSYTKHIKERLGISVVAGGGYGLKTGAYRTLESPAFSVAPYAYRYLGSLLAGVEWAPIYAKMNVDGANIVHYDIYGAARLGVTAEQSVVPAGGFAVGPTLSPAIGSRLFLGERTTLRVEFRDDVLVERRKLTQSTHIKQNANVTVGMTWLSARKDRR
jgi:outer membrane beta-barrel protein